MPCSTCSKHIEVGEWDGVRKQNQREKSISKLVYLPIMWQCSSQSTPTFSMRAHTFARWQRGGTCSVSRTAPLKARPSNSTTLKLCPCRCIGCPTSPWLTNKKQRDSPFVTLMGHGFGADIPSPSFPLGFTFQSRWFREYP